MFNAKEITYGHQITTEVHGAQLTVFLVRMMPQWQGLKPNNRFLSDWKALD